LGCWDCVSRPTSFTGNVTARPARAPCAADLSWRVQSGRYRGGPCTGHLAEDLGIGPVRYLMPKRMTAVRTSLRKGAGPLGDQHARWRRCPTDEGRRYSMTSTWHQLRGELGTLNPTEQALIARAGAALRLARVSFWDTCHARRWQLAATAHARSIGSGLSVVAAPTRAR
jgi:hypothetical protein